jgi:YndJ-like protein
LFGVTRLLSRGLHPLPETSIDAGLLYLPVGGAWLIVYRLGVQPFDYGETIILLTVVHFHFAGFAAPIVAGMAGRVLAQSKVGTGRTFPVIVVALVVAMPLVAAGITFSPWLGLAGTLLLSIGLVLLAVLTITRVLPAIISLSAWVLLLVGALSSCVAMVLASLYSYSLVAHVLILRIPTMAMTHGLLNAFGFATCSLLAWSTISAKERPFTPPPRSPVVAPPH